MRVFAPLPPPARPQFYSDALHATVAILLLLGVTFLAYTKTIPADITGAVYTGVLGYVAGRAGNVQRNTPSRDTDPPQLTGIAEGGES